MRFERSIVYTRYQYHCYRPLVDLNQASLIEDGVYLLNLPGLVVKEISIFPGEWVLVIASATEATAKKINKPGGSPLKILRRELLVSSEDACKVVGRAVLVERSSQTSGHINLVIYYK
jgi:hypothetical protein